MKATATNLRIVSTVLGVWGVIKIMGVITSFDSLDFHTAMYRLSMGLLCVSIALAPALIFQKLSVTLLPGPPTNLPPFILLLMAISLVCLALAGITWLGSKL